GCCTDRIAQLLDASAWPTQEPTGCDRILLALACRVGRKDCPRCDQQSGKHHRAWDGADTRSSELASSTSAYMRRYMTVATGYVGSAAITWATSTTATVSSQSIGTATWDRIVLVAVSVEDNVTIDSCTIGGTAATLVRKDVNTTGTPDNAVAFFFLQVPT